MWSLYQNNQFLEPLRFSNGKTQEDVTEEVLGLLSRGKKIVFIKGVCGTGKSAIALNIARKLGKSSIIVPGKTLQMQYKRDYEENKYLIKENGERLVISVITGRNNHKCQFLEDNKQAIPIIKKEIDSKLNDIFEPDYKNIKNKEFENKKEDSSADNYNLPCKIELKEKNFMKIREYIRQNKNIDSSRFATVKDVKRLHVASTCPYWMPVLPETYELGGLFKNAKKYQYQGLEGTKFIVYERKQGCPFYEQFKRYVDSDVLVFNSLKYKLESALNRKPLTEVEIIDECDEFLDSFTNQSNINVDRLNNSLTYIFSEDERVISFIDELRILINKIKQDKRIEAAIYSNQIVPLKGTNVDDLLKLFINNNELLFELDDESYLFEVEETAKMFQSFLDETYLIFNKKDKNLTVSLVTTNLAKKFKEMINKNKRIVLMSGTLHSDKVLREIFGLEDFKVIDAEIEQQGTIEVRRTGLEKDCKYENFLKGNHSREGYLKALSKCIEVSKKPILVHVNSFHDLPTEEEIIRLDINNIISREKLKEEQKEDKTGKLIEQFKKKQIDILFSTKSTRGVDFPGEECRSIIFTKYPNPDVQDAFWRILKQTRPEHYWDFYKDKAKRELLQRIYRGLRFKEDHVYVLSPDERVLNAFEKKNNIKE